MSKWINRLVIGLIVLAVLISVVSTARERILQDDITNKMFLSLLESFPFSKFLTEIVCGVMHYPLPWNNMQPDNILSDLTILFAMTMVCPVVIGTASMLFLKIPSGLDIYGREDYMNTLGYRVKELLINIILSPLCVLITAKLVGWMMASIQSRLPLLASVLVRIAVMVLVLLISCVFTAIKGRFKFSFVLQHRLLSDLLGEFLRVLVMNSLCIAASLALINGRIEAAILFVTIMFIMLAAIELMLGVITAK